MISQKFLRCMMQVWINEGVVNGSTGAYTEDGTTTKYGIAYEYNRKTLLEYGISEPQDMHKLTEEIAAQIYYKKYWQKCGAEQVPIGCDYLLFDAAVNQGVGYASRMIQECLNILHGTEQLKVDGRVGPKTKAYMRNALERKNELQLIMRLHRKMAYYQTLVSYARKKRKLFDAKSRDFETSWLRRLWHEV